MTTFDKVRSDWTKPIASFTGPRYLAIVRALELALASGDVQTGDRLPPQRDLAQHLSVNIGTIGKAYTTMQERGLVASRVGRGTHVIHREKEDGPRSLWNHSAAQNFIDLSHSFPDNAPVHPAIAEILREWPSGIDVPTLLARQIDAGLPQHRWAGAQWIGRFGIEGSPENVMVTCGGQHGIVLAMAALSRPGDTILTEELAFYGLKSAANMMGRSLAGVRMDGEGLTPENLDIVCRRTGGKVLFCTPTLHNPTTAVMSLARRLEVLEVCRRHDVMIVEDDVWNFMLDIPAVPFAVLDPERTVYITSFSKIIGPGLRIGFLRTPQRALHAFGVALRATTLMASAISAEYIAKLIASPPLEYIVRSVREEARARQEILAEILPAANIITKPDAYYAWLKLSNGWSADAYVKMAEKRGVGITSFTVFEVSSLNHSDAVRICLNGAPDRAALGEALGCLRGLLLEASQPIHGQYTSPWAVNNGKWLDGSEST
jgi:DNA-binding transcriptional MocR family regulator